MFTIDASKVSELMFTHDINGVAELARQAKINAATAAKALRDGSRATAKVINALARFFNVGVNEFIVSKQIVKVRVVGKDKIRVRLSITNGDRVVVLVIPPTAKLLDSFDNRQSVYRYSEFFSECLLNLHIHIRNLSAQNKKTIRLTTLNSTPIYAILSIMPSSTT